MCRDQRKDTRVRRDLPTDPSELTKAGGKSLRYSDSDPLEATMIRTSTLLNLPIPPCHVKGNPRLLANVDTATGCGCALTQRYQYGAPLRDTPNAISDGIRLLGNEDRAPTQHTTTHHQHRPPTLLTSDHAPRWSRSSLECGPTVFRGLAPASFVRLAHVPWWLPGTAVRPVVVVALLSVCAPAWTWSVHLGQSSGKNLGQGKAGHAVRCHQRLLPAKLILGSVWCIILRVRPVCMYRGGG